MRYCSPKSNNPIDVNVVENWLSVDQYIGGVEHAVLHLLYARFFTKAMRDCGYANINEPFKNLMTQGMVCHATYKGSDGQWLYPTEIEKANSGFIKIADGSQVTKGRQEKMSKSKKNLVDPQAIIEGYGADVARLFIMSDTPPEKDFDWNDEGLEGSWRYINRLSRLGEQIAEHKSSNSSGDMAIKKIAHQYLHKITKSYEEYAFNKVLAFCRELTREIEDIRNTCSTTAVREAFAMLIQALNPIVPHIAHELWSNLQEQTFLDAVPWPKIDSALLANDQFTMAVQVNGKLRGNIDVMVNDNDATITTKAMDLPAVQAAISSLTVRKTIIVPKRIINMVVS